MSSIAVLGACVTGVLSVGGEVWEGHAMLQMPHSLSVKTDPVETAVNIVTVYSQDPNKPNFRCSGNSQTKPYEAGPPAGQGGYNYPQNDNFVPTSLQGVPSEQACFEFCLNDPECNHFYGGPTPGFKNPPAWKAYYCLGCKDLEEGEVNAKYNYGTFSLHQLEIISDGNSNCAAYDEDGYTQRPFRIPSRGQWDSGQPASQMTLADCFDECAANDECIAFSYEGNETGKGTSHCIGCNSTQNLKNWVRPFGGGGEGKDDFEGNTYTLLPQ